jgi:hypothetical protein
MRRLFGPECTATFFRHDEEMRELHAEREIEVASSQSQTTIATQVSQMPPPLSPLLMKSTTPQRPIQPRVEPDQDQVQPSDTHRNENLPGSAPLTRASTPPSQIVASSPSSESQNLRRKAILDGLRDNSAKRARMEYDGASSPIDESSKTSAHIPNGPHLSAVAAVAETSGEDFQSSDDDNMDVTEHYYDDLDSVYRCGSCGHELWSPTGECTGCAAGEEYPYYEVLDPEAGPQPEFAKNDYDDEEIGSQCRAKLADDYLDYDMSAYDSFDDDDQKSGKKEDEYEINSFIDDTLQDSDEDGFSSEEEEEDKYKEKFEELQNTHQRLIASFDSLLHQHDDLMTEHDLLRRDFLGSEYENYEDSDDYDEEGMLIVDVEVPDPVVSEIVVTHLEEDSQGSEISPERVRDRVEAFQAAVDGTGWHSISLISAGDNHTYEEVEL